MEEQVRKITLVAACTAVAALVFVSTAVRAVFYAPDAEFEIAVATSTPVRSAVALPERLVIPALHIDTAIQDVGINTKGNMSAPSNYTDVGWYKYGTRPGDKGSAVVAGHLDNGLALDGVFKHLGELAVGDDIFIETEDGTELRFVVSATSSYPYTDVPAEELFNRADTARLNLITCDGGWVQGDKTYDHRLVVYATLKE